jgi:hypothetical protein
VKLEYEQKITRNYIATNKPIQPSKSDVLGIHTLIRRFIYLSQSGGNIKV